MWHEVEAKLGAFIRGQGLAMLAIGIASALGYWLIGLPHVLVLAVLAGLFEAVPMVGPVLAAVPAMLVALPEGLTAVLLVIGFAAVLQLFENNILLPRIMNHSVGVSSLVGLFVVLAFGTLYGVMGAVVAIPLTVVIQVLLDHTVINPDPVVETVEPAAQPLATLRTQLQGIRQHIHSRLRERESRMQVQPTGTTVDQVADTVEQQLEHAVEQVETMLATLEGERETMPSQERRRAVAALQNTTGKIEGTLRHVDATITVPDEKSNDEQPTNVQRPVLAELRNAIAQVEERVQHAGAVVSETQEANTPNGETPTTQK